MLLTKYLLRSLPVFVVISCFSDAQARFKGFYVGPHFAVTFLTGEHRYISNLGGEGFDKVRQFGFGLGLHFGGGLMFGNRMYFGGEFQMTTGSTSNSKNLVAEGGPIEGKVDIKRKNNLNFALIAGYTINPKMLAYARFAIDSSHYEFNYTNLSFGNSRQLQYKKKFMAISPGAGVRYLLTKNLFLGIEYQLAFPKRFTPRSVGQLVSGAQRGFSFRPMENRIFLKISYLF